MHNWPDIEKGEEALEQASTGWRDYTVVTTKSPWALAQKRLPAPRAVIFATNLSRSTLAGLRGETGGASMLVGLGSGLAMDTAKFLAKSNDVKLAQVLTTSSNNACFTRTAWTFDGNNRVPERDVPIPNQLVLDYGLLRRAPDRMNQAGAAEILCSHTALFDWRLAHSAGVDVQWDDQLEHSTRKELARLQDYAPAIGRGELEAFVEIIEVGRKFAAGFTSHPKARFNAGSEHVLAWALEEMSGSRLIHGEAVSLAILLMAHIQNNAPDIAAKAIRSAKMRHQPDDIGTSWSAVERIMAELPDYAERVPWHTIITEFAKRGTEGRRELMARFESAKVFVQQLQ